MDRGEHGLSQSSQDIVVKNAFYRMIPWNSRVQFLTLLIAYAENFFYAMLQVKFEAFVSEIKGFPIKQFPYILIRGDTNSKVKWRI